jgi:uncharacterized RDD family membrane protein YckC
MSEDPRTEPGLFDLPLEPPPPGPTEDPGGRRRSARRPNAETLPLFTETEIDELLTEHLPAPEPEPVARVTTSSAHPRPKGVPAPAPAPPTAGLGRRLAGAGADLVILAAVGSLAALGAVTLEAPVGVAQLPPLALFVLAFSFLYFVVSLAFWGSTPGMSWAGLVARTAVDEPLSFGQTALRWIGTWLTWILAGLPGLLALSGRSFADRLSGSSTYELEPQG